MLIFCIRGAYFTRQGYRTSGLHTLTENLLHALRRRERTSQGRFHHTGLEEDVQPRMDEIRMGLQDELRGQRGWLCRVIEAGTIRRGDPVVVTTEIVAEAK